MLPDGFDHYPGWLQDHDLWFEKLWDGLDWEEREIMMFGRPVLQPRLVDWYADSGVTYRYSGITLGPRALPAPLDELRGRLDREFGADFNSVLCNAYRDGQDSMGWHADDEPELGLEPVIASLNLGATRRFRVRPRGGGESFSIDLEGGSLLMMSGRSQSDWQHAIPKTRRDVGPRINLTFRAVRPS
jgi:alkylated DNA repair dioxygenase AlkB